MNGLLPVAALDISPEALREALSLRVLFWPALFGFGVYLVIASQPIGRPKPDLKERLRQLDVDERIRMELERQEATPFFKSKLLESLLRPVLDDVGRFVQAALARLGLTGLAGQREGQTLERSLQLVRPGVEPVHFFGEKVLGGLIGLAFFPVATLCGGPSFGHWTLWLCAAGLAVGYLAPDWMLARRLATRRTAALMELSPILDLLCLAVSAGLALEQALELVARQSEGIIAGELRTVTRDVVLGRATLVEALEAMAERNELPEVHALVSHLRAAYEQGVPLAHALAAQAEVLREQKRFKILEAGGKASIKMLFPVVVFVLPVLLVVLLYPAGEQLLHLAG